MKGNLVAKKKPGKKKKKRAKRAPASRQQPGLLPGLGGDPWEAPPEPVSRLEVERVNRSISKLLAEQEFESEEELSAFLASLTGNFDDIIAMAEDDPEEEAQDLAYAAMEADSPAEARSLSQQALKLDPYCVDAQVVRARLGARSDKAFATRLRTIVRNAEQRFGEAYMEENRGHFWGLVETRPYMRTRQLLVIVLDDLGEVDDAIAECEGLLALNPKDNQGNRDILRGLYLQAGDMEGVRRLNKEYDESILAVPAWSAVLEQWSSGEQKRAEKQARLAHKQNPHVAGYLTGAKRPPREEPNFYSPGDEHEAALCVSTLGKAWHARPEAMAWLRGLELH